MSITVQHGQLVDRLENERGVDVVWIDVEREGLYTRAMYREEAELMWGPSCLPG